MNTLGPPILSLNNILPKLALKEYLTLSGVEYSYTHEIPVVAPGEKIYVRALLSPTKYTLLNHRRLMMDQERGFYRVYTDFSGGSIINTISVGNSRPDSDIPSEIQMATITAPTINEASIGLIEPLFGTPGKGVSIASGQVATDESFIVLPPSTPLLGVFENQSILACYFLINIRWSELHPESMPPTKDI